MAVSQKEKIFFVDHLSLMLKGGISISESLDILKNESKSRTFKNVLDDILKRVLEGESLSGGFVKYPRIFNKFFQSIVKIGEESGTLEENLKYLRSYLEDEYSLKKKITAALIYPVFVVILAVTVALMVTFFILPKITDLFQTLAISLPLATKVLINSANFLREDWFLLLIAIIIFIIILKIIQRLNFTRFYIDKMMLSLPLIGQINKGLILARFSRIFYTLFKSGVPILETIDICIDTFPNEVYKRKLISIRSGLEQGERISQNLKNFPNYFPPIFSKMILVGEKSGTLEESFLYLANFYEKETDSTIKNISNLIEPILLVLVGIFVCFIILAIIVPIYKFTGSISDR
jgi:type II secretory pathway component PulF